MLLLGVRRSLPALRQVSLGVDVDASALLGCRSSPLLCNDVAHRNFAAHSSSQHPAHPRPQKRIAACAMTLKYQQPSSLQGMEMGSALVWHVLCRHSPTPHSGRVSEVMRSKQLGDILYCTNYRGSSFRSVCGTSFSRKLF